MVSVYTFILDNFDSISKYSNAGEVTAVLDFNEYGVLSHSGYYKDNDADYEGSIDDLSLGTNVNVWPVLDEYIRSLYPFVTVSDYDREYSDIFRFTFPLVLDKAKIVGKMNSILKQPILDRISLEEQYKDYARQDVSTDSDFTLSIRKLEIDDAKYPKKAIAGKLKYLESGSLKLAPGQFFIFRIMKSSEKGYPKTYIEYKLFSIKKDGTAFLYTKQNYIDVSEGKVLISAAGNRFESEDEAINKDSLDYDPADTIISNDDSKGSGNFDMELEIVFK